MIPPGESPSITQNNRQYEAQFIITFLSKLSYLRERKSARECYYLSVMVKLYYRKFDVAYDLI